MLKANEQFFDSGSTVETETHRGSSFIMLWQAADFENQVCDFNMLLKCSSSHPLATFIRYYSQSLYALQAVRQVVVTTVHQPIDRHVAAVEFELSDRLLAAQ